MAVQGRKGVHQRGNRSSTAPSRYPEYTGGLIPLMNELASIDGASWTEVMMQPVFCPHTIEIMVGGWR